MPMPPETEGRNQPTEQEKHAPRERAKAVEADRGDLEQRDE